MLIRKRGAAEAAAAEKFNLTDAQRKRLVLTERRVSRGLVAG